MEDWNAVNLLLGLKTPSPRPTKQHGHLSFDTKYAHGAPSGGDSFNGSHVGVPPTSSDVAMGDAWRKVGSVDLHSTPVKESHRSPLHSSVSGQARFSPSTWPGSASQGAGKLPPTNFSSNRHFIDHSSTSQYAMASSSVTFQAPQPSDSTQQPQPVCDAHQHGVSPKQLMGQYQVESNEPESDNAEIMKAIRQTLLQRTTAKALARRSSDTSFGGASSSAAADASGGDSSSSHSQKRPRTALGISGDPYLASPTLSPTNSERPRSSSGFLEEAGTPTDQDDDDGASPLIVPTHNLWDDPSFAFRPPSRSGSDGISYEPSTSPLRRKTKRRQRRPQSLGLDKPTREASQEEDGAVGEVEVESKTAFPCTIGDCSKSFSNRSNLLRHMKSPAHNKQEGRFVCPIKGCNKSYTSRGGLTTHLRSPDHVSEGHFICPHTDCGKRFAQRSHLKAHLRSLAHSSEGQFCCPCGKKFTEKSNLRRHMRLWNHTEDGEYPSTSNAKDGAGACQK